MNDYQKYLAKITPAVEALSGEVGEKAQKLLTYFRITAKNNASFYSPQWGCGWKEPVPWTEARDALATGATSLEDVFAGENHAILDAFFDPTAAGEFLDIWNGLPRFPYTVGWTRRPYRTRKCSMIWFPVALAEMGNFLAHVAGEWTLEKYFDRLSPTRPLSEEEKKQWEVFTATDDFTSFFRYRIAWALDNHDAETLARLREIVHGDSSQGVINHTIIRGMLMSRSADAHALVADLLRAAKLQEGLRQSIFEAMDECSGEGFLAMLDLMIAEGMERFSSAIRAVQTWTGLHLKAEKPATVKKAFQLIRELLRSPAMIEDSLKSDNALEIYLALWAIAFREIEDVYQPLITLAKSREGYKRFAAFFFAAQTQNPSLAKELILASLDDRSPEAWAMMLPLLQTLLWAMGNEAGASNSGWRVGHVRVKSGKHDLGMHEPGAQEILHKLLAEHEATLPATPHELRQIFDAAAEMAKTLPKTEVKIAHGPFSETDFSIAASELVEVMLMLALLMPNENREEIYAAVTAMLPKFSSDTKWDLVNVMLQPDVPEHRAMLRKYSTDVSEYVRKGAIQKLRQTKMAEEDFAFFESAMRYKAVDIQQAAVDFLLVQPGDAILASLGRLLADKNPQTRLGGLELAERILRRASHNDEKCSQIVDGCQSLLNALSQSPPADETPEDAEKPKGAKSAKKSAPAKKGTSATAEKAILQRLTEAPPPEYDFATGFGLCDPQRILNFPPPANGTPSLREFIEKGLPRGKELLQELSDLIHANRDYEYQGYYETGDSPASATVLGTLEYRIKYTTPADDLKMRDGRKTRTPQDLPLPEVWDAFIAKHALTPEDLLLLDYFGRFHSRFSSNNMYYVRRIPGYAPWFNEWHERVCAPRKELDEFHEFCLKLPYNETISGILRVYSDSQVEACAPLLESLLGNMYHSLEEEKFREVCLTTGKDEKQEQFVVLSLDYQFFQFFFFKYRMAMESDFTKKFSFLYKFYEISSRHSEYLLKIGDFEQARQLGMIDDAELYCQLLYPRRSPNYFAAACWEYSENRLHDMPNLRRVLPVVIDRLMPIELQRGEKGTSATRFVKRIRYFEGLKHFAGLLDGLGTELFSRGSIAWRKERNEAFCELLQACHPSDDDKQRDTFPELEGFDEKRLVEAAMYAPQWAEIIEKHIGWAGLAGGCWFFHAHVNEEMPERKQDVVARYSPISPGRFKDGVLDMRWFREVYGQLGPQRFQSLHDAAKYIGAGANHRRIQIMTDAVLGKLERDDVLTKVREKRSKDYVLAFGLMPLTEADEALARYDVLQTFLKESKQFGSQRRESERKTVAIAMENLAQNAGFADANRFTWNMETRRSEALLAYFTPQTVEDTELSLALDEKGMPMISVVKRGKPQAAIPAKLKKHAVAESLRQAQKDLREQFSLVRASLEKCMETEAAFEPAELAGLATNPVIRPMFEKLIFFRGDNFGFWRDGVLTGIDKPVKLKKTDRVRIAHPAHLHAAGVWRAAQQAVFSQEIIQPFKQVFRELYLPNADEKANVLFTERYAGHQVQPAKTLALLQSRGWAIHEWEGLMKVFHDLEIVAELYSYADWFMPSDIEPPTLERVEFTDRRTREPIPLEKIPPVIFSEVMRDLDLVVSVAHVGGVDPEASLSTVEMRSAILAETLRLLRLTNVTMKKNHAMIRGTLGEYTVHMGSGLVQQMAHGSLMIMPVHSQRRGRLFLPFIDDDPKTAEILTKVILLAEDEKLKDPTILEQIGK